MLPTWWSSKVLLLAVAASAAVFASGQLGGRGSTGSPNTPAQYAPNRDFHLVNVKVLLDVDYPGRKISGVATNTISILRDGTKEVSFSARPPMKILSVTVDGKVAPYVRDGRTLKVTCGPSKRGRRLDIAIRYSCEHGVGGTFGEGGGWHWIEPREGNPAHVGFWTQGETMFNSAWLPTWDYPNDMTSSETVVTVPADWTVISNGILVKNTLSANKKRRTFDWRLTDPHATYLISLAAGPFDMKTTTWRGVTLRYVVPKGEGARIDDSFGDTPDMLSFYSDALGVKYAWPQYAQSAMFDFGGGMENVSATTLQESALTDKRNGFRAMEPLTAHELAHQWFGDLVTCREWGDTWLNEGFATYFEIMYTQHSRGENAFQHEMDQTIRGYVFGAQQGRHALSTRLYSNADAMFDGHSYSKGASVLHTMRGYLGDKLFFGALGHYLTKHRHQPVDSHMLCQAITEWTGIDMEPFFDQWVFKPGHPVIQFAWSWDDAAHQIVATCKQAQSTKDGTPIYDFPVNVGIIRDGRLERRQVHLSKAEDIFILACPSKPQAVLFDPDHSMLKDMTTTPWGDSDLLPIVQHAPSCVDRGAAVEALMQTSPSYETVQAVAREIEADSGLFPAFVSISALKQLKPAELRPALRLMLKHKSPTHVTQAISYLAELPADPSDIAALRSLVNDVAPYSVVRTALNTLGAWDPKANADLFLKVAKDPSLRRNDGIIGLLTGSSGSSSSRDLRLAVVAAMGELDASETDSREALGTILETCDDWGIVAQAVQAAVSRKDKGLLEQLKQLKTRPLPDDLKPAVDAAVSKLGG